MKLKKINCALLLTICSSLFLAGNALAFEQQTCEQEGSPDGINVANCYTGYISVPANGAFTASATSRSSSFFGSYKDSYGNFRVERYSRWIDPVVYHKNGFVGSDIKVLFNGSKAERFEAHIEATKHDALLLKYKVTAAIWH